MLGRESGLPLSKYIHLVARIVFYGGTFGGRDKETARKNVNMFRIYALRDTLSEYLWILHFHGDEEWGAAQPFPVTFLRESEGESNFYR